MESRYERQRALLGDAAQDRLKHARIAILGCGGLGGYLLEQLVRCGVGTVTVIDGDTFTESNLNRQLLCTPELLGTPKAAAAKARALQIDPTVQIYAVCDWLCAKNAAALLHGHDLVLDALDNVPARLIMEDACAELGIPIVHGAIDGWCAQVGLVPPGSGMLHRLYDSMLAPPQTAANLACTCAFCASLQAAEAIKLLSREASAHENSLILFDLNTMESEQIFL